MSARAYQELSLQLIREEFSQNRTKVLLWLATGAGKTYIFCLMIKEAVSRGMPCMVLVRGRKLVDQASLRLFREGVDHGVFMAGHWNYKPKSQVQVCSIDTLLSRGVRPVAGLIVIDEADLFGPESKAAEFLASPEYQDSFFVPVTATPWLKQGLAHLADTIVHPITMEELIDQGYLCGFRYFAPGNPDVSEVDINYKSGDYNTEQLAAVMESGQICGNVIEHWKKLAENRPTILFAVNVEHSKMMAERFRAEGIAAEHCDADSKDKFRNAVAERSKNGTTKIICNVGVFGRGVDLPWISCISLCRPTRSRNLFIQQAGRGTRSDELSGKKDCLLLDHAGNIIRHGFPTDEPDVSLAGDLEQKHVRETKICPECFCGYRGNHCPNCGTTAPETPRAPDIAESNGELVELKISPIERRLKELRKERGTRNMSWVYWKLEKEFGKEAEKYKPKYLTDVFASSPFSRGSYVKKNRNDRSGVHD